MGGRRKNDEKGITDSQAHEESFERADESVGRQSWR